MFLRQFIIHRGTLHALIALYRPMPTSYHRQISPIMEAVIALDPQSVLDVGVGFGKYGVLCREYLELWDGREDYHKFLRRIDGIEAFEDYLTPLHGHIYNHVYIGTAQTVLPTLKTSYDLVLLIDVLEHFTEKEGRQFVKQVLAKHRGILIATPRHVEHQGHAFHNEHEEHISQWTLRKLRAFGPSVAFSNDESLIIYIGTRASVLSLKAKLRWEKTKRWGKHLPGAQRLYRWLRLR